MEKWTCFQFNNFLNWKAAASFSLEPFIKKAHPNPEDFSFLRLAGATPKITKLSYGPELKISLAQNFKALVTNGF